ncbi:MAG: TonB-dependent receptor [Alphaproteobacteria bacterium]|nr:TonB-dependent receptor [Alphaproteobacteria bacterium]
MKRSLPLAFLLAAAPAFAQESTKSPFTLPETVVTANRVQTRLDEVGASVTVLTAEDLERRQIKTMVEALREVPSLSVQQIGGPGRQTSVFTRGANSNHTLVLVDGVRMNDPSDPSGAFNFANLTTLGVDRIEVVRGPASTLYGSDAIGGVINIITAKGQGPMQGKAFAEGGSFRTGAAAAQAKGSEGRFNYNISAGRLQTRGTSVTAPRRRTNGRNDEPDGYNVNSWNSRLGADLSDTFEIALFSRGDVSHGFTDVAAEDPDSADKQRQMSNRLAGKLSLFDGDWVQTFGVSHMLMDRVNTNDPDRFSTSRSRSTGHGERRKAEWQNDVKVAPGWLVTAGTEHEVNEFTSTNWSATSNARSKGTDANSAGYAQAKWDINRDTHVTGGARVDHHDAFGNFPTWRISPTYLVRDTDTRFKAAMGTGFHAPALFQLYGRSGTFGPNPDLQPEISRGWELGFEQGVGKDAAFGSTYFKTNIRDLITSNAAGTMSVNINTAQTYGVESFGRWQPTDRWSLRLDHTYQRTEDASIGQELVRRPKHRVGGSAEWQATDEWMVGSGLLYRGHRADSDADTFGRIYTQGATVMRLFTRYDVNDGVQLFARIENALDRRYEEPSGYNQPQRAYYAGVRVAF